VEDFHFMRRLWTSAKIYIYTMWKSANRIPVLSLVTSNSRFNKIVV